MKKIFLTVLFSVFFLGCDDGDFSIESFDFSSTQANFCYGTNNQFFIYYINGSESLLVQIPESNFPNSITPENSPRTVQISTNNRVIYRLYNSNVSSQHICTAIAPAEPTVTEEWNAVSGTIQIETYANRQTNETTGQSFITGYTHRVVLVNTTFEKSDGNQQLFAELVLGNYVTPATTPNILADHPVQNCPGNETFFFKNSASQAFALTVPGDFIQNTVTPADEPRTAVIGQNDTTLRFLMYDNIPNPATFFCDNSSPIIPEANEDWYALNGNEGIDGIIEVTTEEGFDNQGFAIFTHTINFRKVTFSNGEVTITFGELYNFGEFVTYP